MTISRASFIFSAVLISTCILLGLLITGLYFATQSNISTFTKQKNLSSLAVELAQSSRDLTREIRKYAVTGLAQAEKDYFSIVNERNGSIPRFQTHSVSSGESISLLKLLEINGASPDELEKLALANRLSNSLIALETEAMNAVKGIFKDTSGNYTVKKEADMAYAISLVFSEHYDREVAKIQKPINEFIKMLSIRTSDETARSSTAVLIVIIILAICFIFILLSAVYSGYYSRHKVCLPLKEAADYVERVAQGDLESKIVASDQNEIGTLITGMSTMIDNIVHANKETQEVNVAIIKANELTDIAQKTRQAEVIRRENMFITVGLLEDVVLATSAIAERLSAQIKQSEEGAAIQAERISSSVAEVDLMNSSVFAVATSAENAALISADTRKRAVEGSSVVRECILAINLVQKSSVILKDDMLMLSKHAQEIDQIMGVISDIADQTNLLALNAAIEAARAGEAGRGFAVVADEVRKLAEKTMASTSNVENAIKSIQKSTDKSMGQVEDTVANVVHATELTEQCGTTLEDIVSLAETAEHQVQDIAATSKEQSSSSAAFAHTIDEINLITGKTTQSMVSAADAVNELTSQTSQLNTLISTIKDS